MKNRKMDKRLTIRNSPAEFLIFTSQAGEDGIEVRIEDENIWLTQKLIAKLFGVEVNTINYHLKEIFSARELLPEATIRNFRIVQTEGSREVTRGIEHYNLQGIIAVGFRVNSEKATHFRIWAGQVLKDFTLRAHTTKTFFATVQNNMYFATHSRTAAELIVNRADYQKDHMGLTTWKKAPDWTEKSKD